MLEYLTITDIERMTGVPRHRINYAIQRHGPAPATRFGNAWVWSAEDVPAIEASIAETAAAHKQGRDEAALV